MLLLCPSSLKLENEIIGEQRIQNNFSQRFERIPRPKLVGRIFRSNTHTQVESLSTDSGQGINCACTRRSGSEIQSEGGRVSIYRGEVFLAERF